MGDEALRDEKERVFGPCDHSRRSDLVRGQFEGYRDEAGVAPDSDVETYAAVRLYIDSWRWAGVPFYIRAGKRLPVDCTEVRVELKSPPQQVFPESLRRPVTRTTCGSGSTRRSRSRSARGPSRRARRSPAASSSCTSATSIPTR